MVIKYLTISGSVMVIGPPFLICSSKRGITLPLLNKTLQNLTPVNLVLFLFAQTYINFSVILLVAPITLEGLIALSEEIKIKSLTLYLIAVSAKFSVPITLFFTASSIFSSIKGTCL